MQELLNMPGHGLSKNMESRTHCNAGTSTLAKASRRLDRSKAPIRLLFGPPASRGESKAIQTSRWTTPKGRRREIPKLHLVE